MRVRSSGELVSCSRRGEHVEVRTASSAVRQVVTRRTRIVGSRTSVLGSGARRIRHRVRSTLRRRPVAGQCASVIASTRMVAESPRVATTTASPTTEGFAGIDRAGGGRASAAGRRESRARRRDQSPSIVRALPASALNPRRGSGRIAEGRDANRIGGPLRFGANGARVPFPHLVAGIDDDRAGHVVLCGDDCRTPAVCSPFIAAPSRRRRGSSGARQGSVRPRGRRACRHRSALRRP